MQDELWYFSKISVRTNFVLAISMPQSCETYLQLFFYKFTHGHSATHMVDCLIVSALTIQKYVDIVCDVFTNNFLFF